MAQTVQKLFEELKGKNPCSVRTRYDTRVWNICYWIRNQDEPTLRVSRDTGQARPLSLSSTIELVEVDGRPV